MGVKVILKVQLAPAARVAGFAGHVFVSAKAPWSVIPDAAKVSGAPPEFVSVTGCALLVVLASWPPKFTVVDESVTAGPLWPRARGAASKTSGPQIAVAASRTTIRLRCLKNLLLSINDRSIIEHRRGGG